MLANSSASSSSREHQRTGRSIMKGEFKINVIYQSFDNFIDQKMMNLPAIVMELEREAARE